MQIYPGAIYYHQGKSYLCKTLDLGKRLAIVRPADVKWAFYPLRFCMLPWPHSSDIDRQRWSRYYTKVADFTDVHVVGGGVAYPATTNLEDCPFTTATVGNATVTTRYFAFHRVWKVTLYPPPFTEIRLQSWQPS